MKIYLAGPMRGYPQFNFPAFMAAAAHLRALGHEVFNPADKDLNGGFDPETGEGLLTVAEYMVVDLPEVCSSQAVVVLPKWEGSTGATIELSVAAQLDIPVYKYQRDKRVLEMERLQLRGYINVEGCETPLTEAMRLVYGDRGGDYGHPLDDYTKTAAFWSVVLGVEVKPEQAALCMALVKVSREINKHKRDNLTDLAGYAECVWRIHEERKRREVDNTRDQQAGTG